MNSKIKKIIATAVGSAMAFSAVACGDKTTEEHKHSFEPTKWSYSDTHHWHAATCGHDVKNEDCNGYAVHNIQNGECSVCDYYQPLTLTQLVADYETVAIGFVKDNIIPSVVQNKQVKAEYYYIVGNSNDELTKVNIVWFYEKNTTKRGVELATVTLPSPIPF